MKSFCIFVLCFFLSSVIGHSQDKTPVRKQFDIHDYNYYNHKASVQKTYGFIALSTGLVLYGIGLIQPASNYYIDNDPSKGYPPSKRTPFFIAGTLAELAGIPFFISARKNKNKAAIALKNESALIFRANNYINYPSVSFVLKLQ